jgi:hypothetical protein
MTGFFTMRDRDQGMVFPVLPFESDSPKANTTYINRFDVQHLAQVRHSHPLAFND